MIVQWDLKCARMRVSNVDEGIFGTTERAHLRIKPEKHPFTRGLFFTGALGLVLVFGAVVVISSSFRGREKRSYNRCSAVLR